MAQSDTASQGAAPQADADVPTQIGRYRIVRLLGRGGFAEVYYALDQDSQQPVALKVLRENVDARVSEQVQVRFLAEGRIAQAVDDPAIVAVRETSLPGAAPAFIAMDYVEGQPFCAHFQCSAEGGEPPGEPSTEPPDLFEIARLGHQVAAAMAKAHKKGIVHRDLKPDNVLITGEAPAGADAVRILDFGIAKAPLNLFRATEGRAVTRYFTELGTVMGSPPYMAPEQNGAAHTVDGRADVFALGVMLLAAVCRLDTDALEMGTETLALPDDLDRVLARCPGLPKRWVAVLERMVAGSPEARPSMRAVAVCLQRLAQRNAEFGAAVEAWVRYGKAPGARRLAGLLSWAEGEQHLTEDERLFLRRAPVRKLRSVRTSMLSGFLLLALVLGAAGLASTHWWPARWRARAFEPLPSAFDGDERWRAEQPDRFRERGRARQADQAPSSTAAEVASALPTQSAEESSELSRLARIAAARQHALRALKDQLTNRDAELAKTEQDLSLAQAELATGREDLLAAQRTAAEQAKRALTCEQELRTSAQHLAESTERLRLCTRSLHRPAEPGPELSGGELSQTEASALGRDAEGG